MPLQMAEHIQPRLEEVEISSGVLEDNSFDDLGFIPTQPQSTESEPSAANRQSTANTPIVKHSIVALAVNTLARQWSKLCIFLLITCSIIYGIFSNKQPEVVVSPDVLYVSALTVSENSNDLSPAVLKHIQWWLRQKLEHLPAIKIAPANGEHQLPRLTANVEVGEQQIKLNIQFISTISPARSEQIALVLTESLPQSTLNNKIFNTQLSQLIIGTDNTTLVNDQCSVNSLINASNNQQQCVSSIKHRYAKLLNIDDTKGGIDLKILANQAIEQFTHHSLGYEIMASYFDTINNSDLAHNQLLLAIERNQNSEDILKRLSMSYRQQGQYNRSLLLLESLIERQIDLQYAFYWKAYDLVALGFLEQAQQLVKRQDIRLTTIEDQVYFFGLNYIQLRDYLTRVNTPATSEIDYIEKLISDDIYCTPAQPINNCIAQGYTHSPMRLWQTAALYLSVQQADKAYNLLQQDRWLSDNNLNLETGADRLFYLPTYANILMVSGREKEARALLERFVSFINHGDYQDIYRLALAEAYSLLGNEQHALAHMAQLLASGWLPMAKYQVWSLKDNPNLMLINKQWQFLNLLELIDNRRQLIRLSIKDLQQDK